MCIASAWRARPHHSAVSGIAGVLIALSTYGCSDITHVTNPAILTPPNAQNPTGAVALRAGALSELANGLSYQAMFSGLLVDEFRIANAGLSGVYPEDQRNLTVASSADYPYLSLSKGRVDALIAIAALEQYEPTPPQPIGELFAFIGASEISFAENLCSGVPVATVSGFTPSYGPSLTRNALLAHALGELDSASAHAGGSDSLTSLVSVLRGRALLDSGAVAQAAQAVQSVPTGFAYTANEDSITKRNAIYFYTELIQTLSVADREGQNGLPFVSAADPRLPLNSTVDGSGDTVVSPAAVTSASTPITVASGVEANLITAEAALKTGDVHTWSTTLNALRTSAIVPAMDTLSSDSTTAASSQTQVDVLFRERAFWLFGTGRRHGDVRRLVRQYGRAVNSVYPVGLYFGGPQTYGSGVVFYLSGEQYNPGYTGCTDTNP
jgi:hypothetical protein